MTVRTYIIQDSTLRENCVVKINCKLTKTGDRLIFDFRGSSPEFTNRATNTIVAGLKGMLAQVFLCYVWPDLPRGQAAFAPVEVITDPHSIVNCSYDAPNSQSLMSIFTGFTAGQHAVAKFLYSCPEKYTKVHAPTFNMINTFIWGGVSQHGETLGNLCADLNGMGAGAVSDRDGEHALAPIFATMADIGEQELNEEEVPFLQLVSKKMTRDAIAPGKYRGGQGYTQMVATKDSEQWGFMTVCQGAKIPPLQGLFGGYSCGAYPLCKVKGVDVYDVLLERAAQVQALHRGDHERAAVRGRQLHHPPHGHGLRDLQARRVVHDLAGRRRGLRRPARARPGRRDQGHRGRIDVPGRRRAPVQGEVRPGYPGDQHRSDRFCPRCGAQGTPCPRCSVCRVRQDVEQADAAGSPAVLRLLGRRCRYPVHGQSGSRAPGRQAQAQLHAPPEGRAHRANWKHVSPPWAHWEKKSNEPRLADVLAGGTDGSGKRVWLKSSAYTRRLLLGESGDPWVSAAQYLAYFSQAHGLLRPDVAVIEVGDLFESWLARNPTALASLAGKRRPTFALRKLLELEEPRAILGEVIGAVMMHLRGQAPLVLSMPSPRSWLIRANALANQNFGDIPPESFEDAAMYLADLFRAVSEHPVAGVLLEERPEDPILDASGVDRYRPIINVVRHYRWELALRLGEVSEPSDISSGDIDVLICSGNASRSSGLSGIDVSGQLWSGQAITPHGKAQFHFAEIPPEQQPELVLEVLARLRG